MKATLYLPGQPAQQVTLSANTCEAAAQHLGFAPQLVDVLAGGAADSYTVYAHGDIDEDTPFNEAATEQMDLLLGEWCEVSGSILIVEN